MDTIFALASAPGKAGVSVIRISGRHAFRAGERLARNLPPVRVAALRKIRDEHGEVIDESLVLCFPEQASFTGEPTVEIQCHGSPAVAARLLQQLSAMEGLRQAEAGEFTRRALENDRLSLTEIEGLGDLIESETEAQRKQALRVMSGELVQQADTWRSQLTRAMALLEATIDFVDEDVPVDVRPEVQDLLEKTSASMRSELDGARWAERVRDGFRVAIVGAPNVGKSTLLNYLAGREVAITSEHAGTTRDVIEVRMDIDGMPVVFQDTAGVRDTSDAVEQIGVARAMKTAADADFRVHLVASTAEIGGDIPGSGIYLLAKQDSGPSGISGATGFGVPELLSLLSQSFAKRTASVGVAIKERHRAAISSALSCLETAQSQLFDENVPVEVIAEDLRQSVVAVQILVGRIDVEHVLDEIFSSFCIGK